MAKKLEYNTDYLFNYDVKESVNSVIDEVDGLVSSVNGLIDGDIAQAARLTSLESKQLLPTNVLAPILNSGTSTTPVNYNTITDTLEIPADLIIVRERGSYVVPATNLSLALASGSSAKAVYYNVLTSSFTVRQWSETAELPDGTVLFALARLPKFGNKGLTITCDYTVDGKGRSSSVLMNTKDATVRGYAHRGLSDSAPENTLAAFKLARAKGFAYVEMDLQFTSDNEPVIIHDFTIDRTSNGTGTVLSKTLSELKLLDFGSWKGAAYTNERIPTLREALVLCKKLNLGMQIELKTIPDRTQTDIIAALAKELNMKNNISYSSFHKASLENMLISEPEADVNLVSNMTNESLADIATLKTPINKVGVLANYPAITVATSKAAHDLGMMIYAYTVNTKELVTATASSGADAIITDSINVMKALEESESVFR